MNQLPSGTSRSVNTGVPDVEHHTRDTTRVPLSTLKHRREDGSLELLDIESNFRALFLTKMNHQETKEVTLTAAWFQRWGLREPLGNPPNIHRIPPTVEYLRIHILEWAYLESGGRKKHSESLSDGCTEP